MPQALLLSAGFFTAGGAGTSVATPMAGDTFAVPNFAISSAAALQNVWASGATTDFIRIRSAKFHDANQGIRLGTKSNLVNPLMPWEANQVLYPADTPIVEIDATGAGTGGIATLYSFDDLPGVQPRLAGAHEVDSRMKSVMGCQVNLGAVGAIGQYSAGVAINSAFDNFKAGTDYALLGYLTASSVLALAVSGVDTGNLKVGGPGVADPKVTYNWFRWISERTGFPCIPIINANNKATTLVAQTDSSAAAAQNVTLIFAELG